MFLIDTFVKVIDEAILRHGLLCINKTLVTKDLDNKYGISYVLEEGSSIVVNGFRDLNQVIISIQMLRPDVDAHKMWSHLDESFKAVGFQFKNTTVSSFFRGWYTV